MKSVWGLFLLLLFFLGFFGFQYIPLFGIRFLSILLLIILYSKGSNVKGKYNFDNSIYILMIFLFINMLSCSYFRSQSISSSFRNEYINYYILFVYFVFRRYEINISKIEKALVYLNILFCMCYIWQFLNPNIPAFVSPDVTEAVRESDLQQRFRFCGQAILSLGLFLAVNKMIISKNKKYLIVIIPSLICTLLLGFRSLTFALLISLLILVVKIKGVKKELLSYIIFFSLCIVLFYISPWGERVFSEMMERQESQTINNEDYIRMINLDYHLYHFFSSPLEMFLGAGIPVITDNETSSYGKMITDLQLHGIIYQDWGLLGYSWILGIVPILCIIFYSIKAFLLKVPKEYMYLGVWLLFLVISSFATAEIFRPGSPFMQMVVLAIIDQVIINYKNRENETVSCV